MSDITSYPYIAEVALLLAWHPWDLSIVSPRFKMGGKVLMLWGNFRLI